MIGPIPRPPCDLAGASCRSRRSTASNTPAAAARVPASASSAEAANGNNPQQRSFFAVFQTLAALDGSRRGLDRTIEAAARGRQFSPARLLALQARVYRYNENVELITRLVDKTTSAAKTVLNTQV